MGHVHYIPPPKTSFVRKYWHDLRTKLYSWLQLWFNFVEMTVIDDNLLLSHEVVPLQVRGFGGQRYPAVHGIRLSDSFYRVTDSVTSTLRQQAERSAAQNKS